MYENVLFLEEAQSEFIHTVNYYEGIYSGLGLAFEKEVKKVINLITQLPNICSKRQDGTQRISIHRFPYQIIFSLTINHYGLYQLPIIKDFQNIGGID